MSQNIQSRRSEPRDLPQILELHARVFGPGRFARTAYRVREGTPDLSAFCRVAAIGTEIVAAVRLTEVTIGGQSGALLLGPIVVEPRLAGQGHGRRLIGDVLEDAKAFGIRLVVLVGDEPYYGLIGFTVIPPGQITMPGPVNPARLLAAELESGAIEAYRGMIAARRS